MCRLLVKAPPTQLVEGDFVPGSYDDLMKLYNHGTFLFLTGFLHRFRNLYHSRRHTRADDTFCHQAQVVSEKFYCACESDTVIKYQFYSDGEYRCWPSSISSILHKL